jgi:hypothetical protein
MVGAENIVSSWMRKQNSSKEMWNGLIHGTYFNHHEQYTILLKKFQMRWYSPLQKRQSLAAISEDDLA